MIRQLWTLGIRDTRLLQGKTNTKSFDLYAGWYNHKAIKRNAARRGVLFPLLANIVLNELDWWIASQWKVMKQPPKEQYAKNGTRHLGNVYLALRKTGLKKCTLQGMLMTSKYSAKPKRKPKTSKVQ